MRSVVRVGRLLAGVLVVSASLAVMPGMAQERRVVTTPDADYAGFDYETVKDTDLDSCAAVCLDAAQCRAFTFDSKAGWCFLKSDFGALSAATDAVAGRVIESPALTPSRERRRLARLDFMPSELIDEARQLAGALSRAYPPGEGAFTALRAAGRDAYDAGAYADAVQAFGQALAIASDDAGLWLDFAVANLVRNPQDWTSRQNALRNATAGAVNGFLRAENAAGRAQALALAGDALRMREIWKPAYRAYRASLNIQDDAEIRAAYETLIAEHGFRIVSHTVDADAANPRICVAFSEKLALSRPEIADYVVVDGGRGLAVEPGESQICVDGVTHGERYRLRIRAGLPAADGETLERTAELDVYVRDRAPWVGFSGNAYVLPAGENASLPIVSVNTDKANAAIYRIGERALATALRDNQILRQLETWTAQQIEERTGEKVWDGEILIESILNESVTTAIPIGEAVPALEPGAYVMTARAELDPEEWGAIASQWFVISDLGVTAFSGTDGVHTIVRSLSTAQPVAGVKLRLVAANNDILGEATTDADGYARFAPGLARGSGGAAPQMIDASKDGDYNFIDVTRPAFDLADRGVDGRPAPGPLDVFLSPERGIYRPGETVHLTALVRDDRAEAVDGLPMTLVIDRPDGVEYLRDTLSDAGAGGYSASIPLEPTAMRGAWRIRLYADPKGRALADAAVLVEDFEPERLAFEIDTTDTSIAVDDPATIEVSARYLYGAVAAGLSLAGDIIVRPIDRLPDFPGYRFGLADDIVEPVRRPLDLAVSTDADGNASMTIVLPELPVTTHPLEAEVVVRLTDTNGRAVERRLTLPVRASLPMVGIKPDFAGNEIEEGSSPGFDVVLVSPEGERVASDLAWQLERIVTDYQWYRANGNWNYEPITRTTRIDAGGIDTSADDPTALAVQVDWGRYRLTVTRPGSQPSATSIDFTAGWYVSSVSSETPDVLAVALDKPAYRIGETAKLRLDPRFAGTALVTVMDNRLISTQTVDVPEDGTTVDIEVTDAWGPGAYITAALYRPMDVVAKRMPNCALGLAWAKVDPGDRDLAMTLDLPDEMRPRQTMTIPVSIDNLAPGDAAFVTVAAVDVGILNLTDFQAPAPDDWYFGQRRLGMDIRDIYGLLIDRMQGVAGIIRSGGDGGPTRLAAPPPTERLLAFFSGVVAVDDRGQAEVAFDLPEFNGTVRVMAMAWSKTGVGHAAKDIIVRDPVIVTASVPRFLNTGDRSRLLVEIDNVAGAAGDYTLTIGAGNGIALDPDDRVRTVKLAEGKRAAFNLPIAGRQVGDFALTISLAAPTGEIWPKEIALGVRPPGEPVTRRNVVAVGGGNALTVDAAPLAEFVRGSGSMTVSVGGAGQLDVAGILAALDRYPYGCAEQLTSRAMPLVYLDEVANTIGLASDTAVRNRVQKAISGVLANQSASGAFGLWGPFDAGNLWLDAYVTDFLTRAAEKGFEVPDLARDLALDNLSNRIAYAEDFQNGGEDVAYALYVLARTGRAALGDLRYYADTKIGSFGTALAKAQIGAALALYGDRIRSADAFAAAAAALEDGARDTRTWHGDYGTTLRDRAAVLTLAAENRVTTVDLKSLADRIAAEEASRVATTTQENAWMLLAAAALIGDSSRTAFDIDGTTVEGPLFRRFTAESLEASPVTITNLADEPLDAVVSATGVPMVPEPAGGEGFEIERLTFTAAGEPLDIAAVAQNERIVVVLTITADARRQGHLLVVDPIPAGYEIENPNISASGDIASFDWLKVERNVAHTEARTDRFVAAVDRRQDDPLSFSVAYAMRAVSPGVFAQPAATVEDMYRPDRQARTASGMVEVIGPTR